MILNKKMLNKIIGEEITRLNESCGCGCNGSPGGCGDKDISDTYDMDDSSIISQEDHTPDVSTELLAKKESLKAVVAIAIATSCPITRDALLSTVRDLMN